MFENSHDMNERAVEFNFREVVDELKSPTFFELKRVNPTAFATLNHHLSLGGNFKRISLITLSFLQKFDFLIRAPFLGGLLKTTRGLVFGHLTEALQVTREMPDLLPEIRTVGATEGIVFVDVLIIGSGPGAAVAAQHECGADSIIVVERGLLPRTSHSSHHNLLHVMNDFYLAGQELVLSPNIPQFAQGNVVGGGSEVNSGLYHKLPGKIKDEFVAHLSLSHSDWDAAEAKIEKWLSPISMNVKPELSVIATGAKALGVETANIPRWRTYDETGAFLHRGMIETFWVDFVKDSKNSIQSGIEIIRIDAGNKNFVRVFGVNRLSGASIEFRAKRVHVSAGPISTPSLLARSELIRWSSTRFQWHPMIRVIAQTDYHALGWNDIDPFQAWTDDRELKFGSAVSTPSLLAINLRKIIDETQSKMLRSYYVSFSSSGRGGITPFTSMPWYRYSRLDRQLSSIGLEMLQTLVAAGGGKILNAKELHPMKQSTVHVFGSVPANTPNYVSGTSRLASDERIFVSDASLLPIGPGVNPQGVVMSTVDALLEASF